jgi:hypothetical protein
MARAGDTRHGSSAEVGFETFVPLCVERNKYSLAPHAFPEYRFRVSAVAPDGTEIPVDVHPRESTYEWRAVAMGDEPTL